MDAPHDVSQVGEAARSPEEIRREIYQVSADLHDKVSELREYARVRLGGREDPLHLRHLLETRPFFTCGIVLALGFCGGVLRAQRVTGSAVRTAVALPRALVRGVIQTAGQQALQGFIKGALK